MLNNNTLFGVNGSVLPNILLTLLIPATLITSKLFISMSFTALFLYFGVISLFTVCCGLLASRYLRLPALTLPVLTFAIWFVYITTDGIVLHAFHLFHYYLLFSCLLLFLLSWLFGTQASAIRILMIVLVVSATVECVICIAQYAGILKSFNKYFPCTGTWENPNVTAMFLTMSCPGIYYLWRTIGNNWKRMPLPVFGLVVSALILLSCRTALISLALQLIVILYYEIGLKQKIKGNWKLAGLISVGASVVALPLGIWLYHSKQASADGRLLIWKVSANMFFSHPISGFGYGSFERVYNLFQARYFEAGLGSATEFRNAGFVHMAYNEFLQNGIEGGIIGFLILLAIFISLLVTPAFSAPTKVTGKDQAPDSKALPIDQYIYVAAYAGVLSFVAMSVFNFTLQAIPVMAVFVIYSAILCLHPSLKRYKIGCNPAHFKYKPLIGGMITLAGFGMAFKTITSCYYNYLNKEVRIDVAQKNIVEARQQLDVIGGNLYTNEDYWINYGNVLLAQKQFKDALVKFDQARLLTSDPALYVRTAQCEVSCGDLACAKNNLLTAAYMEPTRIAPKYDLMKVYLQMGDTVNTIRTASDIMAIVPKVNSDLVRKYHRSTMLLLCQLGRPYQPNKETSNKPL